MNEKDKKFIKSWEKAIKLGRLKYSIIYGLIFGIFTYFFSSLIVYFFDEEIYQLKRILIQLSVYCIMGILMFYYIHWKANSNKYHLLKSKK